MVLLIRGVQTEIDNTGPNLRESVTSRGQTPFDMPLNDYNFRDDSSFSILAIIAQPLEKIRLELMFLLAL